MGLEIEATADPHSTNFREAIRLYRQTMPKPLRDPDWYLVERLLAPRPPSPFRLLVAREDSRVIGYAAGEFLPEENLAFLAYLGSDPAVRGRGVGSALYEALLTRLVEDALTRGIVPDGLVLEAEKAGPLSEPADAEICRRRLEFYRRLGAEPIPGITYCQPLFGSQGGREMHLLYHPIGRGRPNAQRGRTVADKLYRRIYGRRHLPALPH